MSKHFILLDLFILTTSFSMAQADSPKPINIAILVYPGVEVLDMSGPLDVFVQANKLSGGQYHVFTVALHPGLITSEGNGITIQPAFTIDTMPKADVLVIPGAPMKVIDSLQKDPAFFGFIKKYGDSVSLIMSVCTGAFLLGSTGLLNGLKATTHFLVAGHFQKLFPQTKLVKNARYVDEGKILTTSGVTSGIDGALHVVEKYSGHQVAALTARELQYDPHHAERWPAVRR